MEALLYTLSVIAVCLVLAALLHIVLITIPDWMYVRYISSTGELVELTFNKFINDRTMLCSNSFGETFYVRADRRKMRGKLMNYVSTVPVHVHNYDGVLYE